VLGFGLAAPHSLCLVPLGVHKAVRCRSKKVTHILGDEEHSAGRLPTRRIRSSPKPQGPIRKVGRSNGAGRPLRSDDGQLFPNPVMEELPTIRPEPRLLFPATLLFMRSNLDCRRSGALPRSSGRVRTRHQRHASPSASHPHTSPNSRGDASPTFPPAFRP
jgi:hypothetical protein